MVKAKGTVSPHKRLTSQNIYEELHQITARDWEDNHGLHFSFRDGGVGEDSNSEKAVDCLSAQEEENLVQETYSEFQHLFGNTTHQVPQSALKNLLKKVYRVVRHPRQRPALKGLLRQAVHSKKRLFKNAWASLLYLTRIFFTAITFVEFATKLGIESIKFQPISAVVAYRPKNPERRRPTEVLTSLDCSSPAGDWKHFFQTCEKTERLGRQSHLAKTVHAEVQLILHVEGLIQAGEKLTGKLFPYIGCSKKCCFFCELFRISHGAFQARGTHQTLFPLWALPQALPQQSLEVLRQFSKLLRDNLLSILTMPCPPLQRDLLQQSSAALSTAQAVQREALTFSIRPQTLRYVRS